MLGSENRPSFDEIVDDIKNNPDYITDLVDENLFLSYIDYIDECKVSFNSGKSAITFDKFLKRKLKAE